MAGVGTWISRYSVEEFDDRSDVSPSYTNNSAHEITTLTKNDDSPEAERSQAAAAAIEDSTSNSDTAPRKRRRLKKSRSSDFNANLTSSSQPMTASFPVHSTCPIVTNLIDAEGMEIEAVDNVGVEPDMASSSLEESSSDEEADQGMSAVLHCLEISTSMTDHLVKVFGGESDVDRNDIRSKLGSGRTSISRSYTLTPFFNLLKPSLSEGSPQLKDYQLVGIQWLLALHQQKRFGILADEMGLGKTAQTITFLNYLYSTGQLDKPSIVTCPATLVDNWMLELKKWSPNLRALKYVGTQPERRLLIREFDNSLEDEEQGIDVVVASLQTIGNNWDRSLFFKKYAFGYLVVDEAHNLKNADSQLHRHMKRNITSDHRLLLTGSPIQNEITELRNLLLLLLPTALTSETLNLATQTYTNQRGRFRQQILLGKELTKESISQQQTTTTTGDQKEVDDSGMMNEERQLLACSPVDKAAENEISNNNIVAAEVEFLRQIFAPFILRRLKSEVIGDLPSKISVVDRCTLEGRQREVYMSEILNADSELAKELTAISIDFETIPNLPASLENTPADGRTTPVEPQLSPFPSPDSSAAVSNASSSHKSSYSKSKKKQYIQNLMFRLRRICNHPLLYKGYYSPEDIEKVIKYYNCKVEGFRDQPYHKVKSVIEAWSDFEIHQAVCELNTNTLNALRIPPEVFLESAKINRMLEIIDDVNARHSKCLVFSQFTTYLDIIVETLHLHRPEILFFRLDGSTIMSDRQRMVNHFATDPNVILFLLSTKAGGVGLNLTAADTVLLMDQDWNPHNDRQAEDRAHRLGQTRPVTIHRLCCRGTLEESILKCAKRKLHLDEAFGGNAELLSAAILKDCFSSSLVVAAKETTKVESNEGKLPPKTSASEKDGGRKKGQAPEESNHSTDEPPMPKKAKAKQSAPPVHAQTPEKPASKKSTSVSAKATTEAHKKAKQPADSKKAVQSRAKTKQPKVSGKGTSVRKPNRSHSDTPSRRDAFLNRFGGKKNFTRPDSGDDTAAAVSRKRARTDENAHDSTKKPKQDE